MVKKIVAFAIHQPLFLLLIVALFIAAGIAAFRTLPVEAFPDITDVQVNVITLFPGHAPEEVEKQITIPLEIALSGLPHSVRMFSHTQFGLSFIVLTFDDQVTDYFARQQVFERLHSASLPPGAEPDLAPLSTPVGEIYRYSLKGKGYSPQDLRTVQDWIVSRYLKVTPGVADVVSLGGFIKQYQVSIDLAKMKYYNITLQQVMAALSRGNANAGGSYLEEGGQQYIIRGVGLLHSGEDIGHVVVAQHGNSSPILIKDISEVVVASSPRQGVVGQDDLDEVVTGIVLLRKGENPSEVLKALKERVATLNHTILPKEVKISPYYDRTWLIHTTLKTVFENLLEGAILVSIVLFLFLGDWRPSGIVVIVIPLSLLSTFVGLRLIGLPANLLSLGAMDFGIIVDGAVIVVENVYRRLAERQKYHEGEGSIRASVIEAVTEVGRPTLFSMLIIITAHLPIFALQRQEGRIFSPMAYTVTSALVGSLLFSMTLVPLLCFFFLKKGVLEKENTLVRVCQRTYRHLLEITIHRRKMVMGSVLVALIAALVAFPHLGTEFLPELNEGTLWVNTTLPPGISLPEVSRVCSVLRSLLRKIPEVETVVSKAGRPEDGTDPKSINMIEVFVGLKPPSAWPRKISHEELVDKIQASLRNIPGIETSISQPIRDNVLESISQIKGQIVIKIFGDDATILQQKAKEILSLIAGVRGVDQAFIDRAGEVPQLQIQIDKQKASRYGLNVVDVEDVIETAVGGKLATEMWEDEKKFGVVVRLREDKRKDIEVIKNILVDTPSGLRVPLDQVADVGIKMGSLNISRELGKRVKAIGVFIRGRDMGGLVDEMQKLVDKKVSLPTGYYMTWGGEFENQRRAMSRLMIVVPLSIFLIFILLFNAFKSAHEAFLILINVPFALVGGIFALLFTGIHLSVSAAIGFIALFGQSVLNGVVMLSCFHQLREAGKSPLEAVMEGSLIRLRTVLMTALLAMLGLLPMALSHGIGSEVQRPLAVVIIGGLISATLLTLIVLPTLYLLFMERVERASHRS